MSTSIGAAIYPRDASNVVDLLRNADAALYQAKRAGGNCIEFFGEHVANAGEERLMLKSKLRRAFERSEPHRPDSYDRQQPHGLESAYVRRHLEPAMGENKAAGGCSGPVCAVAILPLCRPTAGAAVAACSRRPATVPR